MREYVEEIREGKWGRVGGEEVGGGRESGIINI